MKKFFAVLVLGLSASLNSNALTIDLVPSTTHINSGDSVQIDAKISGLKSINASSLGAYDVNIGFDANRFAFNSLTWGDSLKGNQLDINHFGTLQMLDSSASGLLNIFELSFDSATDLENLQEDSFTLFSLIFSGVSIGTGAFTLDINAIGDAYGNNLSANINNTNVIINSASVPEPMTLMLFVIGLLALGMTRVKAK